MRAGASNGLFELIEEIIPRTVVDGLSGDEFFNTLVDFRNLPDGDQNAFETEHDTWFEVATVAPGVRGLRRQRIGGRDTKVIATEMHGVRVYEHLRRLLAGRVDFNQFIDSVGKSYTQDILNDIYACFAGVTSDDLGSAFVPSAGTYDESALLDVIEHT